MGLDVGAKLDFAMSGVVNSRPHNESSRAQHIGNASLDRETVEPKHHVVYELDNDPCGQLFEWQHANHTPRSFFDGPDVALYLRNMFLGGHTINGDSQLHYVTDETILVKFAVHQYYLNVKPTFCIRLVHMCDGLKNRVGFSVG